MSANQGAIEVEREEYRQPELAGWDPDAFAEEQIRGLVQQVFFPGMAQAGASSRIQRGGSGNRYQLDLHAGGPRFVRQVSGTTCLVEANLNGPGLERVG